MHKVFWGEHFLAFERCLIKVGKPLYWQNKKRTPSSFWCLQTSCRGRYCGFWQRTSCMRSLYSCVHERCVDTSGNALNANLSKTYGTLQSDDPRWNKDHIKYVGVIRLPFSTRHMYLCGVLFGEDQTTDTTRHRFIKDWTTSSNSMKHSTLNDEHGWDDLCTHIRN